MSRIFTTVLSGHNHSKMFFLLPFLPMPVAAFELSTLEIWVKCSTTVLLRCSHSIIFFFITFLLLVIAARFKPSILGLRVECSTNSLQTFNNILLFDILSFPVPLVGFKPLDIGSWVEFLPLCYWGERPSNWNSLFPIEMVIINDLHNKTFIQVIFTLAQ